MDVANGLILMTLIILAFVFVSRSLGGWSTIHEQLMGSNPDLFSPQGVDDNYSPNLWLSFMVLWLTCLPMFPQMTPDDCRRVVTNLQKLLSAEVNL